MSKRKEPFYFSAKTIPDKEPFFPIRDTKTYLALFNHVRDEKIVGESSTYYLYDPDAAKLIHQKIPNAYILISLRDPVERVWSHNLIQKNSGRKQDSFHEQINKELKNQIDLDKPHIRLKAGLYYDDVKRYLELFGRKQVKIIIMEEWTKNVKNTVNEITRFLGLNYIVNDDFDENAYHAYGVPRGQIVQSIVRNPKIKKIANSFFSQSSKESVKNFLFKKSTKPKMNEEDSAKLVKFYQDDVRKLEKLLGRKLPWRNF